MGRAEAAVRSAPLDREGLRRRLAAAAPHRVACEPGDDRAGLPPRERPLVPAAVLVGLVGRGEEPTVLLTQRTPHLKAHGGQICFPGGRVEPGDPDPVATALREAEEEVGLDRRRVAILGTLPPYETITGFRIEPVVGWIDPPVTLVPDPFEVAELFEVPLSFVLDPANHRRDSYERDGHRRHFYVLPYADRYIWGATAGILVSFARLLAAEAR